MLSGEGSHTQLTRKLPLFLIWFISCQDCYRQCQLISTFFPDITSQELQLQAQTQSTMKVLVVSECAVLLRGESLQPQADQKAVHMNQLYTFKPTFFQTSQKVMQVVTLPGNFSQFFFSKSLYTDGIKVL